MRDNTSLGDRTNRADKVILDRAVAANALMGDELSPKVNFVKDCLMEKINVPKETMGSKVQGNRLSLLIKINTPDSNKQGKFRKAEEILGKIKGLFLDDDIEVNRSRAIRNPVEFTVVGNVAKMVENIRHNDEALYERVAQATGFKSGRSL